MEYDIDQYGKTTHKKVLSRVLETFTFEAKMFLRLTFFTARG